MERIGSNSSIQFARFQIPPGFSLVREMTPGFLGPTALVVDNGNRSNHYVVKVVYKARIGSSLNVVRFLERLDHVQSLNSPFILPYSSILESDDVLYLIRKYLDCPSLTELVENGAPVDFFALWKQLISNSYADLHNHHIFPTFVKPNNVFLVQNRFPIVTDVYTPPEDIDLMVHSPNPFDIGFLAPEFSTRVAEPSKPADIWSLGILLIYLITKKLPWSTKNVFSMLNEITDFHITSDILSSITRDVINMNPCYTNSNSRTSSIDGNSRSSDMNSTDINSEINVIKSVILRMVVPEPERRIKRIEDILEMLDFSSKDDKRKHAKKNFIRFGSSPENQILVNGTPLGDVMTMVEERPSSNGSAVRIPSSRNQNNQVRSGQIVRQAGHNLALNSPQTLSLGMQSQTRNNPVRSTTTQLLQSANAGPKNTAPICIVRCRVATQSQLKMGPCINHY